MNDRASGRTCGIMTLVGAAMVACGSVASAQECEPGWSALGAAGDGATAVTQAVFDDGSGPALYAGGNAFLGGRLQGGLARWDGREWTMLGVSYFVNSLGVFDDGTGPALYAGGNFRVIDDRSIMGFAKWDGIRWSSVGDRRPEFAEAMAVYDDGTGPALYVAGWTGDPATGRSERMARWDGSQWSFLGEGSLNGQVLALTVYDDGTGPALIVGGRFTSAGGEQANYVARWDGSNWSPMGDGVPRKVAAFAVHDDGQRQTLYAAGGVAPRRWDPDEERWVSLTTTGAVGSSGFSDLHVFDDGRGPALFATGGFTAIDGQPIRGLARWNGESWEAVGEGVEIVTGYSLQTFDDGRGPGIFVGGGARFAGEAEPRGIARWGCDASCLPDLDGDGSLTIFDFLAFQNLFDAGDDQADFDGDGELTIFDFLAFQTAFDAGCE